MQLVVLALVAAAYAEPEAEANAEAEPWWYSNYGYASPYYSGYRYGYSPYYNWGGYRYLWKRDAEAEAQPEADAEAEPWWYSHYGYGGYRGYASPYWNRYAYAYSPYYNYGGYGGYRYLWKRDAEAQPEADAEANPEAVGRGPTSRTTVTLHSVREIQISRKENKTTDLFAVSYGTSSYFAFLLFYFLLQFPTI